MKPSESDRFIFQVRFRWGRAPIISFSSRFPPPPCSRRPTFVNAYCFKRRPSPSRSCWIRFGKSRFHFKCTPQNSGAPKKKCFFIFMGMSVLARIGLVGLATLLFGMCLGGTLLVQGHAFLPRMDIYLNLWTCWDMVGNNRVAIKNTYIWVPEVPWVPEAAEVCSQTAIGCGARNGGCHGRPQQCPMWCKKCGARKKPYSARKWCPKKIISI